MKFKRNILLVVFSIITITAYSQIDSLGNRKIYNWKLNPYDLSLELVELDTSLASFQNFNPLLKKTISPNYLGNLGTAAQARIYYDRKEYNTGFIFSEPYAMYFHLPSDQLYYNTKSPFTLFNFSNGGPKDENEQVLGILHTQNINKDVNFGFDYDLISSDGRYVNQQVKKNSITVFSSYRNQGYNAHVNLNFNRVKAQENGGIDSLHYLGHDDYDNRKNIPVRLEEARNEVFNTSLFIAQEYKFGKTVHEITPRNEPTPVKESNGASLDNIQKQKSGGSNISNVTAPQGKNESDNASPPVDSIAHTDTLNAHNDTIINEVVNDTVKIYRSSGFSISHELEYNSDVRKFFNDGMEESFYTDLDIYIDSTKTHDEVRQKQLSNKLSLNYKYSDKFSAQLSFTNEQLNYEYNVRPDTLSVDSIFSPVDTTIKYNIKGNIQDNYNNNKVSFHIKSLLFNKILFKGYGEYFISGYKTEDSKIDVKFAYLLKENTELSLEGNYLNNRPDYFYLNFMSNNFKWNNEFLRRTEEWDVGLAVRNEKYKLEAKVRYGQISNHVYLDTTAYVNQYKGQVNLLVGELSKRLNLGPVHTVTRVVYQKSTKDSILNLPEYSLYQSLYLEYLWKFPSTGGKLLWQAGFDYRYTSSYAADGYMPPTGLFYRQFDHELADYHRFDFFVNATIKRVRLYLKYTYLNSAINENYYFTAPYYPSPEPLFKFGLAWTFYD